MGEVWIINNFKFKKMKYILRTFGLIRVKDLNTFLENEAKYWEELRKNLTDTNDILHENSTNRLSNYAQCSRDLKLGIYLLNKWW
jgi:hypothetical protein